MSEFCPVYAPFFGALVSDFAALVLLWLDEVGADFLCEMSIFVFRAALAQLSSHVRLLYHTDNRWVIDESLQLSAPGKIDWGNVNTDRSTNERQLWNRKVWCRYLCHVGP